MKKDRNAGFEHMPRILYPTAYPFVKSSIPQRIDSTTYKPPERVHKSAIIIE